jgi:hypothetical protein
VTSIAAESRSRRPPGTALILTGGGVLAALIATAARWGADWPAQEFRAWSARHDGLASWTNRWYAGQSLPGYSVIYPVVSSVLGAALTGLAAVVAATLGAALLAPTVGRLRRVGYLLSVTLVLSADLVIGQVPYLVGVACGVWSVWQVRQGRRIWAVLLAVGCALSSPLAGAFLLLATPAFAYMWGRRRVAPLLGAGLGVLVSFLAGGASGPFPFAPRVFAWTIAFSILAVLLAGRSARPVRLFGATLGLSAVASMLVANPIGGNLARLGQLVALPLLWHVWPTLRWRRPAAAVTLGVLAALWTVWPAAGSFQSAVDPSRQASYYAGLIRFLKTQDPRTGRLEFVFSRNHWESLFVARAFPIARGWERQTDLLVNEQLYDPLTPQSYRRWLDDNAVSFVALSRAQVDYGGRSEAALLHRPPGYLRPAWHDKNIEVWRVRDARPLLTGPAQLVQLGSASLTVRFAKAGMAVIRVRASSQWDARSGEACVSNDANGWLTVTAGEPGTVRLQAQLNVDSLGSLGSEARCS